MKLLRGPDTSGSISSTTRYVNRRWLSLLALMTLLGSTLMFAPSASAGWNYYPYGSSSTLPSGSRSDVVVTRATDYFWYNMGILTSTGYISGYSRTYTSSGGDSRGVSSIRHIDKFTCSSATVTSIGLGASGPSISGGVTSKTATWNTNRTFGESSTSFKGNYHYYRNSGKFYCKVTNVPALAKTSHSMTGSTRRWGRDYWSGASWSKWW